MKLITEELKIKFSADFSSADEITTQIRKFIGNLTGKLTKQLFEIVREEAYRIGTFTYEITYNSKAFKIYIANEFDFSNENLMQKEVMLYLLKSEHSAEFTNFLYDIESLSFEQNHTNKYIESIFNIHKDRQIMNEMEHLYEEERPTKNRNEILNLLGAELNFENDDIFGDDDTTQEE
ncbi:MAG: hypothetical protein ABI723_17605 [Bacteroidia bacterium]